MKAEETSSTTDPEPSPLKPTNTFKSQWPKDFHVSPFNSRKGNYSLLSTNPFSDPNRCTVNNTITLLSSKSHVKLIARIFSVGESIDPTSISKFSLFYLLLRWCLTGFLTFPRILYEAFRLFFQRRLYVWYRPEVYSTSIGRKETESEAVGEEVFRSYLDNCVRLYGKPVRLIYRSHRNEFHSFSSTGGGGQGEEVQLEMKILTPQFFSDLVNIGDVGRCISKALKASEDRQTIFVSGSAEEFFQILTPPFSNQHHTMPTLTTLRWTFLHLFRPTNSHPFDTFTRTISSQDSSAKYRIILTKNLLGFDLPDELIWIISVIARLGLSYLCVDSIARSTLITEDGMREGKSISEVVAVVQGILVGMVWIIKRC